ncbi:MAG: CNNM domain-containing protein [Planctomycetota bacterium]
MDVLIDMFPWLCAMAVLIGCSAFFSGSEAALFYLHWDDRRELAAGGRSQRAAAELLKAPDRLLSAVLLWNLATNMTYFGFSSIVALRFEEARGGVQAVTFSVGAMLTLIFLSEMLPKSIAVLSARRVSGMVGIPLAAAVRVLDPAMPLLGEVSLLSRRLIWPGFQSEQHLNVNDLARAVELSRADTTLMEQERTTLRNIVMLSDIRAEEWMRPRTQFVTFQAPVSLGDLEGNIPPSGYLLVTEPDHEDIVSAINLTTLADVPAENLQRHAKPVTCIPWCATVADVLQQLQEENSEVAVVVNEYGETIGIMTRVDILGALFHENPSRTVRLLDQQPIAEVAEGVWHLTGMTSVRRLQRYFQTELPETTSITVGGIIQDALRRLAQEGDEVDWNGFHFRVLEAPRRGQLLIELSRVPGEEEQP